MRYKHLPILLIIIPLLFTRCCLYRKIKDETERIRKEAQQLYDDANRLLPSSIKTAAEIGREAVDEVYKVTLHPKALRVIARSSATMLAHEAARTIIMRQAKKFDRIFGTNRSEAVCSMLLGTYCYPLLDDIITLAIDLQAARLDPSFTGDTTKPPLDTLIMRHLSKFNLDNAVTVIKGFGSERHTPDYIRTVGMRPVNTATYAATRNWKDLGLVYQYRITDTVLEMKRSDEPWKQLALPGNRIPRIIAADNNRCLVLTTGNELWWYCARDDQAQWSISIMETAVDIMALKPAIGEDLCGLLLPHLARITDKVAAEAAKNKYLKSWGDRDHSGSEAYWKRKCEAYLAVVLSIDKLLLTTDDGMAFTAADYADWTRRAHREGAWSNLLSWHTGNSDTTFTRGSNLMTDSIADIAIGHWNGTVVTVYALAKGKIWFIDEEIIHPDWKPIQQWNKMWAVTGKEYNPIKNTPYPLNVDCRIDASNSVIAVAKPTGSALSLFWLRWDYHQKDDFIYWPIDWCEHAWYTVTPPRQGTGDFRITTMGDIDPRESNTVWSLPAPTFTFNTPLPDTAYRGLFGDIPREAVSTYPVDLYVAGNGDTVQVFSVKRAELVRKGKGKWSLE